MNSCFITCTLAAVQRKRGTSIKPLKKPTPPPPPQKRGFDSQESPKPELVFKIKKCAKESTQWVDSFKPYS